MAKLKESRVTYPAGVNEPLYLKFDDDGYCTAHDAEDLIVTGNYNAASDVGILGAHLHPVDDRDRSFMLDGLRRQRDYYTSDLDKRPSPTEEKRLPPEIRRFYKDLEKAVDRVDAEIVRLGGNAS